MDLCNDVVVNAHCEETASDCQRQINGYASIYVYIVIIH